MITLTKRLKAAAAGSDPSNNNEEEITSPPTSGSGSGSRSRISIRDKLLVKEVQEMESTLPTGCKVKYDDPNALHDFILIISPDTSDCYWSGGKFRFHVVAGEDYNMAPPSVKCLTRIWHPNINEDGQVCLSILRQNSIDGMGWAPTRRLKDVIWGLNSLFTDLLNFDDPLNIEAAEHYQRDNQGFRIKVRDWVHKYARR